MMYLMDTLHDLIMVNISRVKLNTDLILSKKKTNTSEGKFILT